MRVQIHPITSALVAYVKSNELLRGDWLQRGGAFWSGEGVPALVLPV
jgi:hypothetical protein